MARPDLDAAQPAAGQDAVTSSAPVDLVAGERRHPDRRVQQILHRHHPAMAKSRAGACQTPLLPNGGDNPKGKKEQADREDGAGERRPARRQPEERPQVALSRILKKNGSGRQTRMVRAQRT